MHEAILSPPTPHHHTTNHQVTRVGGHQVTHHGGHTAQCPSALWYLRTKIRNLCVHACRACIACTHWESARNRAGDSNFGGESGAKPPLSRSACTARAVRARVQAPAAHLLCTVLARWRARVKSVLARFWRRAFRPWITHRPSATVVRGKKREKKVRAGDGALPCADREP